MKKSFFLLAALSLFLYLPASAKHAIHQTKLNSRVLHQDEGTRMKLILGNKTYDVQMYNLSYLATDVDRSKAEIDPYSAILGTRQSNTFSVSIRSSKVDQELLDWILSANQQPKDGRIIVYDSDSDKIQERLPLRA